MLPRARFLGGVARKAIIGCVWRQHLGRMGNCDMLADQAVRILAWGLDILVHKVAAVELDRAGVPSGRDCALGSLHT